MNESQRPSLRLVAAAAAFSVGLVGCGGNDATGSTLTGSITHAGSGVEQGTLQFQPRGSGSTAYGIIEDGTYRAFMSRSLDGIKPGTYEVAVLSYEVEPGAMDDNGKIYPTGKAAVPRRYLSYGTSGIEIEVPAGEDVVFDIELTGIVEDTDLEGSSYQ